MVRGKLCCANLNIVKNSLLVKEISGKTYFYDKFYDKKKTTAQFLSGGLQTSTLKKRLNRRICGSIRVIIPLQ